MHNRPHAVHWHARNAKIKMTLSPLIIIVKMIIVTCGNMEHAISKTNFFNTALNSFGVLCFCIVSAYFDNIQMDDSHWKWILLLNKGQSTAIALIVILFLIGFRLAKFARILHKTFVKYWLGFIMIIVFFRCRPHIGTFRPSFITQTVALEINTKTHSHTYSRRISIALYLLRNIITAHWKHS